jgi:acyl carrier protein
MATYDETLAVTIELLKRHVDPAKSVEPGNHIQNDLGLDSLGVMEFVADVEERYDVNIPNEELANLATVSDVAKALTRLAR